MTPGRIGFDGHETIRKSRFWLFPAVQSFVILWPSAFCNWRFWPDGAQIKRAILIQKYNGVPIFEVNS